MQEYGIYQRISQSMDRENSPINSLLEQAACIVRRSKIAAGTMPGVLQIEAMAQCGGLFILNTVDEPERYSTYFMKIDGVKFRQKVVPGDTLIFRVELLAPMRRGISSMKGYVFVGEKVVCEAEFTAQIVKNK